MATTRGALVAVGSTRGVDAARRDGRARPRSSRFATPGRTARRRFPPDVARAAAVVAPPVASSGPKTIVLLSIHAKLPYGLMVGVVGDAEALGEWEPENAYKLKWTEGHIWTGRVELPANVSPVQYKLVTMHKQGFDAWEKFGNRELALDGSPVITLSGTFGGPLKVNATLPAAAAPAPPPPPPPPPVNIPPPPPPPPIPGTLPEASPVQAPDFTSEAYVRASPVASQSYAPALASSASAESAGFADSAYSTGATSTSEDWSASTATDADAEADDPYAAFEARVSATFAKLKSATERNNARSMSESAAAVDDGGEEGYGSRGYQASSDYYNGTSSSYSSGARTTFDWGVNEEEEEEEEETTTTRPSTPQSPWGSSSSVSTPRESSSTSSGFDEYRPTYELPSTSRTPPAPGRSSPPTTSTTPLGTSTAPPEHLSPRRSYGRDETDDAFEERVARARASAGSAGSAGSAQTAASYASYATPPPPPPPPPPSPRAAPAPLSDSTRDWRAAPAETYSRSPDPPSPPTPPPAPSPPRDLSRCPPGPSRVLAENDEGLGKSWLEKLGLVAALFDRGSVSSADALAASSVYLRWQGAGEVECGEDDGRGGPAAASLAGREIFYALERAIRDGDETRRLLARQIHPWLPSFSSEFTEGDGFAARARALAQSIDAPETIRARVRDASSKLLRNAGPVALFEAESILDVVDADSSATVAGIHASPSSSSFSVEFLSFVEATRRYFNCAPALDRLESIRRLGGFDEYPDAGAAAAELDDAMRALSSHGVATYPRGDASGHVAPEGRAVRRALRACTAARGHFAAALDSGLLGAPEDAPSAARRQATRMAEMALEELAHVLLTRATHCAGMTDETEEEDVAGEAALEALLTRDDDARRAAAEISADALRNVALAGFRATECHAAARELEAATAAATAGYARERAGMNADYAALREKAAVERAARLAEAHASTTRDAYGDVPANMAAALGLPPYAGDAFVDGVVRGAAPHPLARFLRPLRRAAIASSSSSSSSSSSAERCVAAGAGTGRLVEVDRLSPGCLAAASSSDDPAIVFAWRVTGDEDVFAAGRNVRGIISANALLPTTRLATRARQEGIPMTATSSPSGRANAARAARELAGEFVTLVATPDGVTLNRANDDERDRATREHREERREGSRGIRTMTRAAIDPRVETRDATRAACAPLGDASTARCGAKAAACADLLRVAARPGSGFRAPDGVVLPFGCLELCARERGVERRLAAAAAAAEAAALADDAVALADACDEARAVAGKILPPPDLAAAISAAFAHVADDSGHHHRATGRVVVRASCDADDLARTRGSGLRVSVVGARARSSREVAEAVRDAWTSAYAPDAVRDRVAAGRSMTNARVAVMVQAMLPADVSFVAHTGGPAAASGGVVDDGVGAKCASDVVEVELALGGGDALASAGSNARGSPWRVEVNRHTGEARTTAFASVGVRRGYDADVDATATTACDYSREALTTDDDARETLARRLAAVALAVEAEFGEPQCVEGCVVGDEVWVVQTKPRAGRRR